MDSKLHELICWAIFWQWGKPDFNCFIKDTEAMVWHLMDRYRIEQKDARSIVAMAQRMFPEGKKMETPIAMSDVPPVGGYW